MLYVKEKRVEFTFHAQRRKSERRITDGQIVQVLENPDTERQARSRGCRRAERQLGKNSFGVVYREERRKIKIITVW